MLLPSFRFNLRNAVLESLATVGKFDGKHPSLACATNAGKIFIHSPHRTEDQENEIRYLNLNQQITAVASGKVLENNSNEILFVGTQTNILAYDVENNADVFFKEVPDGVNVITVGPIDQRNICIVGGNCTIQGFSGEGREAYWTVTGDNVSSMTFADINGDGEKELIVGSEDFEIRVFHGEEVINEITEVEKVTKLCPVQGTSFGYGLANGNIGVYDGTLRLWRSKTKHKVTAIESFDLNGDGVNEVIVGWSSGKMEVRNQKNGDLIYKDSFQGSISSLLKSDYRMDGHEELICLSLDGEVRGYLPISNSDANTSLLEKKVEEETIIKLTNQKQELMQELRSIEEALSKAEEDGGPTKLKLNVKFDTSKDLELVVNTTGATIRTVAIFAEQIFSEESFVVYPKISQEELRIPLKIEKHIATDLFIKSVIGNKASTSCYVFECVKKLPKFGGLFKASKEFAIPEGSATFKLKERTERVAMWMSQSFIGEYKYTTNINETFINSFDNKPLQIIFHDGMMTLRTDDMKVAGEIIQDLAESLKIEVIESLADFPGEMRKLVQILAEIEGFNLSRMRLTAEMADNSNLIKTLVIKAEDSRILNEVGTMKRIYRTLFELNQELIREYNKRANNTTALMDHVKQVLQMIDKAAALRVGPPKIQVIALCKSAMKSSNSIALFQIMKFGKE